MQKIAIIGAGIAGLTAGSYLQMSGFDTDIYEMHTIPGGFCTSWRRKGFLFEGGMHWLSGSKDDTVLNRLWRETGALADNNPIHLRDPFWSYYTKDGVAVHIYRNLEKLRAHLLDVSPADAKAIETLCNDIKQLSSMAMPIMDVKGVKQKEKTSGGFGSMFKMMPALSSMMKLLKISAPEYLSMFQSDAIRNAFYYIAPPEFNASSLVMTLVTLTTGDGGYAEGGSLRMAQNMARHYENLGGRIHYGARVQKITVTDKQVTGIMIDGAHIDAAAVVVASDTLPALDTFFDTPLDEKWTTELKSNTAPQMCIFCGFGVDADLSDLPESLSFEIDTSLSFAGTQSKTLVVYNYATYEGYAPKGKTALTTVLIGDTYDYWLSAKNDGSYAQKKEQLAQQLISAIEEKLPQEKGKFEVWDIATPLTFERYCGSYKGSWMSVWAKGEPMRSYPTKSKSVSGLYFAGQRLMPPGGMPVAVMTGRQAAQHVCKDNDAVFCNTTD